MSEFGWSALSASARRTTVYSISGLLHPTLPTDTAQPGHETSNSEDGSIIHLLYDSGL